MTIFLWVLLLTSVLVVLSIILARIPAAVERYPVRIRGAVNTHHSLYKYITQKLSILGSKIWHFVLEAKDLKPPTKTINQSVEKVKKVFRIRIRQSERDPAWLPEISQTIKTNPEVVQPQETIEGVYLDAIKKDANNREAYEGLGRLYLQEKNYAEAEETFRFLTRLDPLRDVYFSNLGLSLYSLGKYKDAARAYEQALKLNAKVPTRWINLALCYEALEEFNKAVKAITNAQHLDPRNINYLTLLADLYVKLDNKVRAEEVLEQILALDPTNRAAREKLMKLKI